MARQWYFFHVFDGVWLVDDEGEPQVNIPAALARARNVAQELLQDDDGGWHRARIEVADEEGKVVGEIAVRDLCH